MLTSVDIHGCNRKTIRDAAAIKRFTAELCKRLGMKRFGETVVVDFGAAPEVAGFSLTQLIETSLVSGHFGDGKQNDFAYLDIFSCKYYDPQVMVDFSVDFFEGKSFNAHVMLRGCEQFPEEYERRFAERNVILGVPRRKVASPALSRV